MCEKVIHIRTTVEEMLAIQPNSYSVFLNRKTNCIGCFLQRFCTLQDVAETYQISLHDLITDLEKHSLSTNPT
jgi:hypothetical protein